MSYATAEEFAAYARVEVPEDADRMLQRAADLIDQVTRGKIISTNDEHLAAARDAECAIVEYWLEAGEEESIIGRVSSYSVGSVQVTYGKDGKPCVLPQRAYRHLLNAGLLYAGVDIT